VCGFVDLDGPTVEGRRPGSSRRLEVRSTGNSVACECGAPVLVTDAAASVAYRGSHLAFLSDGRASAVLGAIMDWIDTQAR
jgi:hypothetical protein